MAYSKIQAYIGISIDSKFAENMKSTINRTICKDLLGSI